MTFGYGCWLHLCKDPKSKVAATDAAHVVKRSRLGTSLAYATPRLARPLCRDCHRQQELGLDPLFRFPYADVLDAITAHNEIARSALPIPEPWIDAWKT